MGYVATVSVSEMNTFLRCRRKYLYQYVQNLRPKRQTVPIAKGILIHSALEAHYKGQDWTAALRDAEARAKKEFFEEQLAEFMEIISDSYKIVRGYISHAYTSGIDAGMKVLDVERDFKVKLPNGHIYEGKMDLVYRNEVGLVVRDHKTVGQIPTEGSRFIDWQTALYYAAAKVIYKEQPAYVELNYLKSKPPKEPELTQKGGMSKAAIDTDWATYLMALRKAGLNPDDYKDMKDKLANKEFFRLERMPRPTSLVKAVVNETTFVAGEIAAILGHEDPESLFYPRFVDRSCEWGCPFKSLCHAEMIGHNPDFVRNDQYVKAEHVVEEEEDDE